MTLQERLPPPSASYLYPSPSSDSHPQPPLSSPHQHPTPQHPYPHLHPHSQSQSHHTHPHPHPHPHHPAFHRSDSMPQPPHSRPSMLVRTSTNPGQASGDFVLNHPVGMVGSSSREDEDREELTTKGRKRKRLAKACSACHKNKRRCDGFAPCSNCEFSSRPCLYINAQGEVIPPPRTRDAVVKKEGSVSAHSGGLSNGNGKPLPEGSSGHGSPERNDNVPLPPPHDRTPRKESSSNGDKADKEPRGFVDPLEAVDRDTTLSSELVDIFFNHIQPYAAMLHGPTFQYRLFLGRTSPLLLDAIYALSAHLCINPTFLGTISASVPTWARGESFAERAHHTAKRLIDTRLTLSSEEKAADKGTWEETEFVQALYLLSVYYASVRQSSLGLYFLDVAIDILRPASTASLAPPPTHLGLSTIDYLTLLECRNRTFWLLVLHDLCAAANGRPRRLLDHELYNIPLPGDESQWDRWGGGGSSGREGSRRDGLAVGTGTWLGEEGQVGELGHVLRVLVVFSDIMTVANNGGPGSDTRGNPAQHEAALKSWALSLPRHLRFDENTLTSSVNKLSSPLHTSSRSAWLFAYMHALAECGMFYLQATLATNGASWAAQRQSQAVDNIAVILEAVGVRGRESPLMLFPLLVVSNWHDHLRSSPAPPTAQQMLLDERLATWWGEASRDWGFERVSTIDRGLYNTHGHSHSHSGSHSHSHPHSSHRHSISGHASSATSAREIHRGLSPLPPPPSIGTSSLGLYGTSPIAPLESVLSASGSTILPTPVSTTSSFPSFSSQGASGSIPGSAQTHRYSVTQLPPLRQRANTLASIAHVPSLRSPSPRLSLGGSKGDHREYLDRQDRPERERVDRSDRYDRLERPDRERDVRTDRPRPALGLGFSEPHTEIKLPPLPPMDPSPRLREPVITPGGSDKGFKFPSFWKDERGSNGAGASGGGKDEKRSSASPRFNPYLKDRTSPVKFADDRRAVSPLSKGYSDERKEEGKADRGEARDEADAQVDAERSGALMGGPVGIAALISAAEEKSRERETNGGMSAARIQV